jgi:hypothetical protein
MKKSQIVSFDLAMSVVIFVIFLGTIGFFFISTSDNIDDFDFELQYVYKNIENNLRISERTGQNIEKDFLKNYRINETRLLNFYSGYLSSSIDEFVIHHVDGAHGIGLAKEAYDTCIYFTDIDKTRLNIVGIEAIGQLDGNSCDSVISASLNPCQDYRQAFSLMRPVLFDEGDPLKGRILQMNVVICKI